MAELRERELNWCLLGVWMELISGMGHRLILSVVVVGVIVGCSKREETPPATPAGSSTKTEAKAPAIESPVTNAGGNSAAVGTVGSPEKAAVPATNAVKATIVATNALAE